MFCSPMGTMHFANVYAQHPLHESAKLIVFLNSKFGKKIPMTKITLFPKNFQGRQSTHQHPIPPCNRGWDLWKEAHLDICPGAPEFLVTPLTVTRSNIWSRPQTQTQDVTGTTTETDTETEAVMNTRHGHWHELGHGH